MRNRTADSELSSPTGWTAMPGVPMAQHWHTPAAYSHAAGRARIGWKNVLRPDGCAGLPHESGTPAAAVDLPCPVGSLDDVEHDQARLDCRAAAMAADFPPAPGRDAGHAAVPGEPGSGCDRCRPASPV